MAQAAQQLLPGMIPGFAPEPSPVWPAAAEELQAADNPPVRLPPRNIRVSHVDPVVPQALGHLAPGAVVVEPQAPQHPVQLLRPTLAEPVRAVPVDPQLPAGRPWKT